MNMYMLCIYFLLYDVYLCVFYSYTSAYVCMHTHESVYIYISMNMCMLCIYFGCVHMRGLTHMYVYIYSHIYVYIGT